MADKKVDIDIKEGYTPTRTPAKPAKEEAGYTPSKSPKKPQLPEKRS
jgi:hypothetical protein